MKIEKNQRNRKNWERGEYTGRAENQEEPGAGGERFEMVRLRQALHAVEEKPKTLRGKSDKKRSSVTAAFCEGILEKNGDSMQLVDACEEIFSNALQECGFEPGRHGFSREKSPWKMQTVPSTSFEVIAHLDDQLRMTEVNERALKWVSANIVHGGSQLVKNNLMVNHDFRVNICTKEGIAQGSKLHQTLVPRPNQTILTIKAGLCIPVIRYHLLLSQRGRSFSFHSILLYCSC